jgi:predicted O-linked N-acetylglucosamine transferase (SPINDLY family)
MGVPVVTMYGNKPAGRTTSCVLTSLGRKDWVTFTSEQYIAKVVEMAEDTVLLAKVRKTLRDELVNSPVVTGYREAVEVAYRDIFKLWASIS